MGSVRAAGAGAAAVIILVYSCGALRSLGAYQVPEVEQLQPLQEQSVPMMMVMVMVIDELN